MHVKGFTISYSVWQNINYTESWENIFFFVLSILVPCAEFSQSWNHLSYGLQHSQQWGAGTVCSHTFLPLMFAVKLCLGLLYVLHFYLYPSHRRVTCIRKPSRLWSTPFPALHPITLRCGRPLRQLIAMSVRGCCGVLPDRVCAVLSVVSNAMRSARTCWMLTVYKVRSSLVKILLERFDCYFFCLHHFNFFPFQANKHTVLVLSTELLYCCSK